jgi:hypothetical protein
MPLTPEFFGVAVRRDSGIGTANEASPASFTAAAIAATLLADVEDMLFLLVTRW